MYTIYKKLVSLENILASWDEYKQGKMNKMDIGQFEYRLEDNIFAIHHELMSQTYRHGFYQKFNICDPKPRVIHKAAVRDRLVHHLVFKELCAIFAPSFIHHSYSARIGKGTHLAMKNLAGCLRSVSRNYTSPAFTLKCDIRKFFHSIPHNELLQITKNRIKDKRFLWVVEKIVRSFPPAVKVRGLPLGNVTSQIFANIYLNELDKFVKHKLRAKNYFRYADDFVIAHSNFDYLYSLISPIRNFLKTRLDLELHPKKISIRKFRQGIDFLGYIILPYHIVLRTKTRRRMFKKIRCRREELETGRINANSFNQSLQSYLGVLKHSNGYEIRRQLAQKYGNFMLI